MADGTIKINAPSQVITKLDRMAGRRGMSRSKLALSIIQGACISDDLELKQRVDADEMKLAKHFMNVDLLQDLQYLGPKQAELTSRELDAVVLFYRDKANRVPHLVHMFKMSKDGGFSFSAHALGVLGYCISHLVPKAVRTRLTKWALKMGDTSGDVATSLLVYLSKLYEPSAVPDGISEEISEDFRENQREASANEAFERR